MKHIALSAALLLASAPVALAAAHGNVVRTDFDDGTVLASELMGMRVYTVDTAEPGLMEALGVQDTWNDVGEVDDIVISRDGKVEAVIVDVGGFLGIGEKAVALDMGSLQFVADTSTEDPADFFIVAPVALNKIEDAPTFTWPWNDASEATEANTAAMPAGEKRGWEKEGYTPVDHKMLTTEDLTGERVYDARDKWIGEVSQLLLNDDGKLKEAVIDVGGFLGIGEKPVAIPLDRIRIVRDANSVVRVYVDMTEEQLEALPTFEN
jgi:sporulation protein YlmC with PRC-barrel domain